MNLIHQTAQTGDIMFIMIFALLGMVAAIIVLIIIRKVRGF